MAKKEETVLVKKTKDQPAEPPEGVAPPLPAEAREPVAAAPEAPQLTGDEALRVGGGLVERSQGSDPGVVTLPEGVGAFALGPQPDAAIVVAADLAEATDPNAGRGYVEIEADGTPLVGPRVPEIDPLWRHVADAERETTFPTGPADENGNPVPIINTHSEVGARLMEMKLLWPVEYRPKPEPSEPAGP